MAFTLFLLRILSYRLHLNLPQTNCLMKRDLNMLRKDIVRFACTMALFAGANAFAESKAVKIDPAKSSLSWVGKKVTGQHSGTVAVKDGVANVENGKLVGGSFDVDMSTITVTDITDASNNKKLTDHLKSNDFFSAANFPTANFKINKAEPIAAAKAGEPNYTITGDLSIKGITNELTFPAVVSINDKIASAKGKALVDRTKWQVRYGSGKFFQGLGDKLIYDDFEVTVDVTGAIG